MAQTKVKLISDGVIVQGNLHASHGITTAHIGEGNNLYYTDARVGSYLSSNGYATQSTIVAAITDSAPSTLDTLNELAAALGDDANFSTTVTNNIATKMPLAGGTFTGDVTFQGGEGAVQVIGSGNQDIKIGSTGSGFARIYIDGSNGDFSGSDYVYIGQNDDKSVHFNVASSAGTTTFTSKGVTNLVMDGANSTFSGEVTLSAETQYLNFKKASTADVLASIISETDAGTGGKIRILTKRNGDTAINALTIDDNQNVGIGTASPAKKLEVATTGINQSSTIRIQGTDGNGNGHPLDLKMNGADDSFSILIGQGGGATPSTILFNGNRNGNVGIGQAPSSFANWRIFEIKGLSNGSLINFENSSSTRTGAIAMNDASSLMRFQTFTSTGISFEPNNSEAMRITSSGAVGIGTTSPSTKLHISGGDPSIRLTPSGSNDARVDFTDSGGTIRFYTGYDVSSENFVVTSDENGFGSSNIMVMDDSGNVGIGTTSPGSYDNESDDLVVFNSTTPGITIATDNAASRGALRFADGISGNETYRGALEYNHSGDIMSFRTAGVQRMNLTSDGNLVIGGGSAYSGTGVTSLTVNNDSYPTLALGTLSATTFAIIAYGTYNLFASSNNFVFDSGKVGIGTTVMNGKLSVAANDGTSTPPLSSGIYVGPYQGNTAVGSAWSYSNSGTTYTDFSSRYNNSDSNMRFIMKASATPVYAMTIKGDGRVGIGTTSPDAKLAVHGTTGTKNTTTLNSNTSSVYETSVYFTVGTNSTSNHYITTTSVFPPMASGGYILVEVAASGYGSAGSNGFVFKYISGGYGGHYNIPASYHPTEIIADTHTSNCNVAIYYPNSTTIGITVTNNQGTYSITGVMRVKITTTYA